MSPAIGAEPRRRPLPTRYAVAVPEAVDVDLREGCYRLELRPAGGAAVLRGTLRVDHGSGGVTISGDLYRFGPHEATEGAPDTAPDGARDTPSPGGQGPLGIPVYPRDRYAAYLVGTASAAAGAAGSEPLERRALSIDRYDLRPLPPGAFDRSFPVVPDRAVTVEYVRRDPPSRRWPDAYYEGRWLEAGAQVATVAFGWVSPFFRRCVVEIDTVAGASAPRPVPARTGAESEDLRTVMASAGWAADVRYDRHPVGAAGAVDAEPTARQLHELMTRVREQDTDLDVEWRVHVLAAPGHAEGELGLMYDMIDEPREGVVVYSEAAYTSSPGDFGAVTGRRQSQLPRAYLRGAAHELSHAFNMIHQDDEGGPDNSVTTTTEGVAAVLRAASLTFPDDIALSFNERTRHRLVHFPDPVVRPGGLAFRDWVRWPVPLVEPAGAAAGGLEVAVTARHPRVQIGEPVLVDWTVANRGRSAVPVPDPVSAETGRVRLVVVDGDGRRRPALPGVIRCDGGAIRDLPAGAARGAGARLYWSAGGFVFDRPGTYQVEVSLDWSAGGRRRAAAGRVAVSVEEPVTEVGRLAMRQLRHPDVGRLVASGGAARHPPEAARRLRAVSALPGDEPERMLRGYAGLLP